MTPRLPRSGKSYYNELDPFCCEWLRNLMRAGHIADGEVDSRSIVEVQPDDVRGFAHCHFFAGIGGWAYAARLAGWPDDIEMWTGSAPCQPFSAAGKRAGHQDERHLWPAWFRLIGECRPAALMGEQVAGADGLAWLDVVLADLEALHYAVAAADLPAAGIGAPHIRQRIYFVADADSGTTKRQRSYGRHTRTSEWEMPFRCGGASGVADSGCERQQGIAVRLRERGSRTAGAETAGSGAACLMADTLHAGRAERRAVAGNGSVAGSGSSGLMADAECSRSGARRASRADGTAALEPDRHGAIGVALGDADDAGLEGRRIRRHGADQCIVGPASVAGFWSDAEWIACRDGKARPVESRPEQMDARTAARLGFVCTGERWTLTPLINKGFSRVGRLRAYGNAICAPLAADVIAAFMECRP